MIKIQIPENELEFTFARSSGSGGQNVNKVNTKANLHWKFDATILLDPEAKQRFLNLYGNFVNEEGKVFLSSQKFRSQKANMDDCLEKLTHMIQIALIRPKIRRKTKPKRSAIEKRLKSKKLHSEKKKMRSDY